MLSVATWKAHLDIRAGLGFGNGEADALVAGHDVGQDCVLKLLGPEVEDRGASAATAQVDSISSLKGTSRTFNQGAHICSPPHSP